MVAQSGFIFAARNKERASNLPVYRCFWAHWPPSRRYRHARKLRQKSSSTLSHARRRRRTSTRVIRTAAGNFHGTTEIGGGAGAGVVFKVDAAENETSLHNLGLGRWGLSPSRCDRRLGGQPNGTTAAGGIAGGA